MSPRAFALFVCLAASTKWSRLRYVAAALGFEFVSSALDAFRLDAEWPTASLATWLGSTSTLVATAANFTRSWRAMVATCAIVLATMALAATLTGAALLVVCTASFVAASLLARSTTPQDVERSATLAALVGTFATSLLALFVGTDDAYTREVVSTSNQITHLAIAAIVLWAMRR